MSSTSSTLVAPAGQDPQQPHMEKTDYIYCEDCKMVVDFWKYDHNIEDAGHEGCNWRYVTEEELVECVKDCLDNGCFEENFI